MRPDPTQPHPATDPLEAAMREALLARGHDLAPSHAPETHGGAAGPLDAAMGAAVAPPPRAEDYVIRLPRAIAPDPELEAAARSWFHAAGLPQNLVNGIVAAYCRCLAAPPGAAEGTPGRPAEMARAELAREWGEACDSRIALARSVIARCAGQPQIAAILAESGLGDDPWLIRSLAALAEAQGGMAGGPA
jgi:hypothetical protein